MYPGVIIEYDDQSEYKSLPIVELENRPLMAAVFTSDKGPEGWTRVSGSKFFELYGENISFKRHGQPLLQAAMSINRGAELLCKRLVAGDATYANIGIFASVTDKAFSISTESVEGATKFTDLLGKMKQKETPTMKLLYVISDIGTGVSAKKIKITADYKRSKNQDYVSYKLTVTGGMTTPESFSFSVNPYLIVNSTNISLQNMVNNNSSQIRCEENIEGLEWLAKQLEGNNPKYISDILFCKDKTGVTLAGFEDKSTADLKSDSGISLTNGSYGIFTASPINVHTKSQKQDDNNNLVFTDGVNEYAKRITTDDEQKTTTTTYSTSDGAGYKVVEGSGAIKYYTLDSDVEDLTVATKIDALEPVMIDEDRLIWEDAACAAFSGDDDTYKTIYNVDMHKIVTIVDANYPDSVKSTIQALADFREDFMYLRDMGLNITSIDSAKNLAETNAANSKFSADYYQSYDIVDPYSERQVKVTIGYDLALLMIDHYNRGLLNPTAGIKNNMIIENAVYGTISHIPVVYQSYANNNAIAINEKEELCDAKINYASYIDNRLVLETLYTTQEKNSQWSYISNVMGIQEVIRAIRTHCPAIRYSFITGDDLEKYKKDVNEIIEPYRSNYMSLELEYVADAQYTANKIFYAVLKVKYKEFEQTEWFKVTALATESTIVE